MLTASVDTLIAVTGGELIAGSGESMANGIAIDSRQVQPGGLFIALPGEHADGHEFLSDAVERGARVLMVTKARDELSETLDMAGARGVAVVRVADGLGAVHSLAGWHRGRLHARVIGITGSTGKTTSKDFITSVLRTRLRVVATEGNRNNELGMPLTIFSAGSDTDALVLEMGMRGLGQIAHLAEIARPDAGLVTNVGTSHIEILGTQEAVAAAKGELVRAIAPTGDVFLNGDDAFSESLTLESQAPVTLYGFSDSCDVRAADVQLDEYSRPTFTLVTIDGCTEIALPVPGRHNVYNALAAAAVGLYAGLEMEDVKRGLEGATVTGMRMEVFSAASGVTVVNDAYNANPSSMRAAVETLADMKTAGRKVAVLGDMAELGSLSELAHFQLGESIAALEVDVLVTVGDRATRIGDGAQAAGMEPASIRRCANATEASEVLDDLLGPDDVVLVKASRVMGLERVVEGIVTPRVR